MNKTEVAAREDCEHDFGPPEPVFWPIESEIRQCKICGYQHVSGLTPGEPDPGRYIRGEEI